MDYMLIVFRLLLTFLLAFGFGIERQKSHKPVGFGTFIFVSAGSCTLSLIALSLESPLSLIGATVSSVGFLGAGALINNQDRTFGFTTAAAIWIFAIIGIALGAGMYSLGLIAYSFVWVVVLFDKYMELEGFGSYKRKIIINTNCIVKDIEVRKLLEKIGVKKTKLISLNVDSVAKTSGFVYFGEGKIKKIKEIPSEALNTKWVSYFKIE